jgi:hypothetical protein
MVFLTQSNVLVCLAVRRLHSFRGILSVEMASCVVQC